NEPSEAVTIRRVLGLQHLHGDLGAARRVDGKKQNAHAARAEHRIEAIAPCQGRPKALFGGQNRHELAPPWTESTARRFTSSPRHRSVRLPCAPIERGCEREYEATWTPLVGFLPS